MKMMKPFSVGFKAWLLVMIPVVVEAGHHPRHGVWSQGAGEQHFDGYRINRVRWHHRAGEEKKEVN